MIRRAVAALLFACFMIAALSRTARAHVLDLSQGRYWVEGTAMRASLVFASSDLAAAVPGIDDDRDGRASQAELDRHRGDLEGAVVGALVVRGDGAPCPGVLEAADVIEADGVRLDARFTCPAPPRAITLDLAFLERFPPAHRHVATLAGRAPALATPSAHRLELGTGATSGGEGASFAGMLRMGATHILTGYDHLAFLLALILVGGRPRALVAVVTAFTVAHSLTLGLAALHVLAPSPRLTEAAIALSIVYVAVENFIVKDASRRWRITFAFGLVHGFGFASALGAIDLPRSRVPAALLAFNLGVELGQLAVLALLAAPLHFLRRSPWYRDRGVKIASAALAAAGLVLFAWRLARG